MDVPIPFDELQNQISSFLDPEAPSRRPKKEESKPSTPPRSSRAPTVISLPRGSGKRPPKQGDAILLECSPREEGQFKCVAVEGSMQSRESTEQIWLQYSRKYRSSFLQVFGESIGVNVFAPHQSNQSGQARGSGFFITREGHFLTNSHVIEKAVRVRVKMHSMGEGFIECNILGLAIGKDVALCQIRKHERNRLKDPIEPLPFGDSDKLEIPQALATCGFPLGHGGFKVTLGNLSGIHRDLNGIQRDGSDAVRIYLQITTPLAQGVSGGCVLNSAGEVVGIASQGNLKAQNVGYAIPSKVVLSILRSLFSRAYNGSKIVPVPSVPFEWQTINRQGVQIYNVDDNYPGGVLITRPTNLMLQTLPAGEDLKAGDVIVQVHFFNPYSENTNYLDVNTYRPDKKGTHLFSLV